MVKEIKTGEFKQKDILEGEDHIETVESEKYLGDIITDDGKTTQISEQEKIRVGALLKTSLQHLWKC